MKRFNNLYSQVYDIENLKLADAKARKGKGNQHGVKVHDKNRDANIEALYHMLKDKTYKTSPYKVFTINEGKERQVYSLPYFPDRIAHHAIINILGPVLNATLTADTYSCIKGKGIHAADKAVKYALKDIPNTTYCLKIDIKKYYPSVDHDILKLIIRRKIKDADLLELLDGIIDSADGIPIGNLLSQYFANLYLMPFDHWIKEQMGVKYYFRYLDDMVIFLDNKPYLHTLQTAVKEYLQQHLKLELNRHRQIFPVASRGVDFLGYVYRHTHTLLRKSNKQSFARAVARGANKQTINAHIGWAKHCNSQNLRKKLLHENL